MRVAAGVMYSIQGFIISEKLMERINPPGFEYTVAPPNAPSNMRMGVRTNRGPISTNDICGGPLGCKGSFSIIWANNGQAVHEASSEQAPILYNKTLLGNCETRF